MVETVWLARHGSRLDFVDPQWRKSAERPHDPPLSPDGLVQGKQLGARLKNEEITQIFSSPFLRCVMTADIAARQLAGSVKIESGFSEWLNADWFSSPPALLPLEELERKFPSIDNRYSSRVEPSYPETGEMVLERTGKAIEAVAREHEGAILVVGHGATVYGSLVRLLGFSMDQTSKILGEVHYCCLCKLSHGAGSWRLDLAADVSHLETRSGGDRFH
ncbi:MAG: histidine phosphatase family protein [Acidobacteria bacterium]|nr:MAG: histidine phosphatase family protein [Acidobacteriota bacterium]